MLPRDADLDAPHRPEDPEEAAALAAADLDDDDGQPAVAPPVVAVVVTHEPGEWFEDALAALAAQDYPALSVLVIDAASEHDPTARVAKVLPGAYVRKLAGNPGYGPASNEVLQVVEGASFFVFCHDDVAPAPDAVRAMVEEAFRSNAGIVSPKLVQWDDPTRLAQVGLAADKTGVPAPLNEPGELDQEQHDAVADVFVAPGGFTLVRADLFRALGGFDPAIGLLGEDLDLSWRAQVAGARVIVAPTAVVRHVEGLGHRHDVAERRRLQARHRLRTMLTCYSPLHLIRVVPQAAVLAIVEIVYSVLAGRLGHAREVASAWSWNLGRLGELRANRRRLQGQRQVPDSEVRRLQVRGSARLNAFLRGQIGTTHTDDRLRTMTAASRELADSLRAGEHRSDAIALVVAALLVLLGSRLLLIGDLPGFADLPRLPGSSLTLLGDWFSGWRDIGLGSDAPAPSAFGLLGIAGTVLLGSVGLLRRLLVLGPLVVGGVGAWQLLRDTGARRARIVCTVAFLAMPVPYDAIARGRGGGLLVWAATPWFLRALARAAGDEPFRHSGLTARSLVLRLGLQLAVVAALAPFAPVALVVLAVGVALGSALVGRPGGAARAVGLALGAAAVAFVLHLPWTLDLVRPGASWTSVGGVRSTGLDLSIGDIVRFRAGPLGAGPLGLGFLAAALLPLVIGREWRLRWAVRAWVVALTCWGALWAGQQSWFRWGLGPPEALLAPASAALAVAIALGLLAFEHDLRGYRFGWRQASSVAAAGALVLGIVPMAFASADGRWGMPDRGPDAVLGFLRDEQAAGSFRVLWIGDPDVLPVDGHRLADGLAYGTSAGLPRVEDRLAPGEDDATRLLADAVLAADRHETARLGRLLAPMGVRYVVVAEAATPFNDDVRPVPAELLPTLDAQLDLQAVAADPLLHVYRNVAWAPERSALGAAARVAATAVSPSAPLEGVAGIDLSDSSPALQEGVGRNRASGPVTDGSFVALAQAASPGWSLTVDGKAMARQRTFGWANGFVVDRAGRATLSYDTPVVRYLLLLGQVALWALVIRSVVRAGRRNRVGRSVAVIDTEPAGAGGGA